MIVSPLTFSINASTFTPIVIPSYTEVMDVLIFTADKTAFEIATDVAGTDAITIEDGNISIPRVNTGETLCYVKGSSTVDFYVVFARSA